MKLFYENISQNDMVPVEAPLEAVLDQALDVFERLPEDDGSSFGLITDEQISIQFYKFNRFLWRAEIPDKENDGFWTAVCSPNQIKVILKKLFDGEPAFSVYAFEFEKNH